MADILNDEDSDYELVEDYFLVTETVKGLKEKEVEFEFKYLNHSWKAFISMNDEDLPILRLFDEKIAFENLCLAPKIENLYRHRRHNNFQKRVKKTSFEMIR